MNPTLVILTPKYLTNPNEQNGTTKQIIQNLALKKATAKEFTATLCCFTLFRNGHW